MRSTWLKLGLVILLLLAVAWAGYALNITPERVRTLVLSFDAWAPVVYVAAYAQPIIPLPASVMTLTGGLAFGPVWGMLAALSGAATRACGQFLVARWLGRETVSKLLRGKAAALDARIGRSGFATVLLIRLIPNVPFDMQNYGLGLSRVRFPPYALATLLGIAPGTFLYVYFGYSLTDPRHIWKLAVAVLLIVGLLVLQRRLKRRASPPPSRLRTLRKPSTDV